MEGNTLYLGMHCAMTVAVLLFPFNRAKQHHEHAFRYQYWALGVGACLATHTKLLMQVRG